MGKLARIFIVQLNFSPLAFPVNGKDVKAVLESLKQSNVIWNAEVEQTLIAAVTRSGRLFKI